MGDNITIKGILDNKYFHYFLTISLVLYADFVSKNKVISCAVFILIFIIDIFQTYFLHRNKYSYNFNCANAVDFKYYILFAIVTIYCLSPFSIHHYGSINGYSNQIHHFREKPQPIDEDNYIRMLSRNGTYDRYHNPKGNFNGNFELVSDLVIIEKYSGLMWERRGSNVGTTWNLIEDHINFLNSSKFGGYDDWRVPTIEELSSLMKNYNSNIYISNLFQSDIGVIWSSDSVLTDSELSWYANFNVGRCLTSSINTKYYVKAVRSCSENVLCR